MKSVEMNTSKILAIRAKAARQDCLTRMLSPPAHRSASRPDRKSAARAMPFAIQGTAARSISRLPAAKFAFAPNTPKLAFALGTLLLLTVIVGAAAAQADVTQHVAATKGAVTAGQAAR